MPDKVLLTTRFLSLVERDGWYYFAQIPGSAGGVIILLYQQDKERPILGRYEICPAHGDGLALTAIAGGDRGRGYTTPNRHKRGLRRSRI